MNTHAVCISVPARVHLSLLCLERGGYRRNGGFGFAINPGSVCLFEPAKDIEVIDDRVRCEEHASQVNGLRDLLTNLREKGNGGGVCMTIQSGCAAHVGLGSGTALAMAAVEGFGIATGAPATPEQIRRDSRRGGTSGVGVTTYFQGGFVFEVGRKQNGDPYKTSERAELPEDEPLVVFNQKMPEWPIAIFQPKDLAAIPSAIEDDVFRNALPISRGEVSEILYEAVLGMIPGLMNGDKSIFSNSLLRLQQTSWKAAERSLHRSWLANVEANLYDGGALGCGLSSFGPSLVVIAEDQSALMCLKERVKSLGDLAPVSVANAGRTVIYV